MKVVEIAEIRQQAIKTEEKRVLDAKASIVILEEALLFINLNKLVELDALKKDMRLKILELKRIANGKR